GVEPAAIRKAELTPIILQLVASRRGVAALPNWALTEYLPHGWLRLVRLGASGVWRTLYAAVRAEDTEAPFIRDFLAIAREVCFRNLDGIRSAKAGRLLGQPPSDQGRYGARRINRRHRRQAGDV